ncbi:hypothetical protein Fmac_005265 [Flemingia macrophylla]|uniref:Bromo domain-containing protein n=1 Tax=Flemingia macrophylla TaxID=520843 RepID=A0ABD1N788_9FABA
MVTWSTWEELLLGGAILRHGTRDWTVVAGELQTRTVPSSNFTPEVCKAKYEELQQQYSECTDWFEELRKKRTAELKKDLEQSEELIGSLESKLESVEADGNEKTDCCRVDDGSDGQGLQVPYQRLVTAKSSAKEMSKDAGSFTRETETNWSRDSKPEVSESPEQEKVLNVGKPALTVDEGQEGGMRNRRGKRKRKDSGRNVNDLSADVCKESSISNCGEIVKSSGVNKENANLKKDGIKDLMEIVDSVMVVRGSSAFCRRLDSQKRGRYKNMIRQHMDFDTIRSKIRNKTIVSMMELFRDLLLLTNNAITFYSKNTREYKTALKIRDLVIKASREKLNSSSSLASTSSTGTGTGTAPVDDPSVKVRSMQPGNHKILAKVAGGRTSAERVSVRAKRATPTREKKRGRAKGINIISNTIYHQSIKTTIKNIVGFFSYLYRIEHVEPNLLYGKFALFRSGKSYGCMKSCAIARIYGQSYFR